MSPLGPPASVSEASHRGHPSAARSEAEARHTVSTTAPPRRGAQDKGAVPVGPEVCTSQTEVRLGEGRAAQLSTWRRGIGDGQAPNAVA